MCLFFFFKQKTAYEMRISDWSSDVCSSDLAESRLGLDADPRQQRAQFLQDAALGDRQDQGLVGGQDAGAPQASGVEGRGTASRQPDRPGGRPLVWRFFPTIATAF